MTEVLYSLNDIYDILQSGINYSLPSKSLKRLKEIETEIIQSIPQLNIQSNHSHSNVSSGKQIYSTFSSRNMNKPPMNTKHMSASAPITKQNTFFKNTSEDLSWENVRTSFKTTKIDKKEGIEKKINEIRICLNKMSNKNYESQRDLILANILDLLQHFSPELSTNEIETNVEKEESSEDLKKIANAIFDIASSNKFYSEMYAQLYSELIVLYPIFQTVLVSFLDQYNETVQTIKSVNPDIDYDLFCQYNKQNDKRKATTVFIVHLMKKEVVAKPIVIHLVDTLLEKVMVNIDEIGKMEEIEEMTELVNLFMVEGYKQIQLYFHETSLLNSGSDSNSDFILKWECILERIRLISQYKVKEKKSMSSRILFKYMDIVKILI
jgi:hypothetical protein